jgi:molecular chaperone GrpE
MRKPDSEPGEPSVSDEQDYPEVEDAAEAAAAEAAAEEAAAAEAAAVEAAAAEEATVDERADASAGVDASHADNLFVTLDDLIGEDLVRLVAERDEYLDSLRRLQADFDNYRKRAMRQQTDLLDRASEHLLIQLLPVLDVIDLAEAHSSPEGDPEDAAIAQIGAVLRETLKREGLERIDEVGVPFDPTVHDAVAHEDGEDDADGAGAHGQKVADVMRAGYSLRGRVVRPAMVKVKG